MKNLVAQFTLTVVALIALTFIMGYTRPAAEQPKEYMIIECKQGTKPEEFSEMVKQKMTEGWQPVGGVTYNYAYKQAMVK